MERKEEKQAKMPEDFVEGMWQVICQLEAELKFPAVNTHKSTLNSVTAFVHDDRAKNGSNNDRDDPDVILYDDIFTSGRLKTYQTWLLNRNVGWGTVSTYMRVLQSSYRRLVSAYDPHLFDDVHTKVEAKTKRALPSGPMGTLLSIDLSTLPPDLRPTLAFFLLMFMLRGMPFIDLAFLRKKDVKGNLITYCRHKTGRQLTVRIPREAEALMAECRDTDSGSPYLFPILDGSLTDERLLYACYQKALRKFNKRLVKLASLLLPGMKLSSYTARHTWATLMYHSGTMPGLISKALGHSSVMVTEAYLKPFDDEKVDDANDALIARLTKRESTTDNTALMALCRAVLGGALLT